MKRPDVIFTSTIHKAVFIVCALIAAMNVETFAQPVRLGWHVDGTNLVITAKPSSDIHGFLTGAVFTVRWLHSTGVRLGAISSPVDIVKAGIETKSSKYMYQKFVEGAILRSVAWIADSAYTILTVELNRHGHVNSDFELASFAFADGGDPYVEIDGKDRTDYATPFFSEAEISALPVELTSFTALAGVQGATLSWTTATETNNAAFDVERAQQPSFPTSGIEWVTVGRVDGSGTSNAPHNYTFHNTNVQAGCYSYRLKQIDRDGRFTYSHAVEAVVAPPGNFTLSQNYPNPFNPATKVNFSLAERSAVTLKLYDAAGREVQTVVDGEREAGYYSVTIDGRTLASGVYMYRIAASHGGNVFSDMKRFVLLK